MRRGHMSSIVPISVPCTCVSHNSGQANTTAAREARQMRAMVAMCHALTSLHSLPTRQFASPPPDSCTLPDANAQAMRLCAPLRTCHCHRVPSVPPLMAKLDHACRVELMQAHPQGQRSAQTSTMPLVTSAGNVMPRPHCVCPPTTG
jgi:hypothetical protein